LILAFANKKFFKNTEEVKKTKFIQGETWVKMTLRSD